MKIRSIKTEILKPPKIDLFGVLDEYILDLKEGDIFFITSKIISLSQNRCVKILNPDSRELKRKQKDELIFQEAEGVIERREYPENKRLLTITKNLLICAAGIDESNANGYFILLPENSNRVAKEICLYLREKFKLKKLGVVITDSHSTPLHRGSLGTTVGFFGINPLNSHVGKSDIFGRQLVSEVTNVVDSLATMAVFVMGETNEKTPFAVISDFGEKVEFTDEVEYEKFFLTSQEDMFSPILKKFKKPKT